MQNYRDRLGNKVYKLNNKREPIQGSLLLMIIIS